MNQLSQRARASSLARALLMIGDRWTLLVLREAFLGERRFEAFRRACGAPRATLARRLQQLVRDRLLVRSGSLRAGKARAARSPQYRLSPLGRALYPVSLMIWRWERRYAPVGSGLPGRLVHLRCGHAFTPVLRCAACDREVQIANTGFRDADARVQAAAAREVLERQSRLTRRSAIAARRAGTRRALA
ncbi:MAG: helix-turn-helix transcriptional regulator, partial [Steroidobacteraceae bacterium]|nr:helix-turn-helix transcriptional regulator [Steroidobacteraceae bacterium]MDW8260222.1 helix-turn-helix domain-containing protein [Gammaproteobacteria bacterium]